MTIEEKLRIAEENSSGALSFTVSGLRYAKCRTCGKIWNISRTLRIRGTGYRCPKCFYAEKQNTKGGTKRDVQS